MAPKKKFSKEKIIETAFEIAKAEGIDSITIRKVAEKMGSSIAPIYVNFKNIDELIQEVVKKIFEIPQQMLSEGNTGSTFQDIGAASLRFAREYSVLYRDLVMKSNNYMKDYDEDTGSFLVNEMKKDPELKDFTEEELNSILFKMRVFQVGLSVMVANGLLSDEYKEDKLIEILENTGKDVITATRFRKENLLKKRGEINK